MVLLLATVSMFAFAGCAAGYDSTAGYDGYGYDGYGSGYNRGAGYNTGTGYNTGYGYGNNGAMNNGIMNDTNY